MRTGFVGAARRRRAFAYQDRRCAPLRPFSTKHALLLKNNAHSFMVNGSTPAATEYWGKNLMPVHMTWGCR